MSTSLAYVAGFVDGEGCILIAKNGSVQLLISNTSLATLNYVKDTLGVGSVRNRKQRVNKNQFLYSVYGEDCVYSVEQLLPYLIEKKEQAELLLQYRKECRPIRMPGIRGQFRNDTIDYYRTKMTEMKRKESVNNG